MSPGLGQALAAGRARLAGAGVGTPDLDARVLLAHAAGVDAAVLWSRPESALAAGVAKRYEGLLARRERREPVAYLTGGREFWSLALTVDPRVLVPRPETETLVEAALARLGPGALLADVGTGSGAVALALASELDGGRVHATDLSAGALAVARRNAEALGLGGRIEFALGDLLEPVRHLRGRLDAVVSNPPYVPSDAIARLEPEVRDHEPRAALDGGPDGLRLVRRLIAEAPDLLRPGGWLLVEIGDGQAPAARACAERDGRYDRVGTARDLAGTARVLEARRA